MVILVTIMRYRWQNNVGYISSQSCEPMRHSIFRVQRLIPDGADLGCMETDSSRSRFPSQWRRSQTTEDGIQTEVYQAKLLNKQFASPLNVVCILKTNLLTNKCAHVLLFSSDLALEAEQMIDYYRLRFQLEFNFRDAKQYWGLEDFMNVKPTPVSNAANLSMFMVNLSTKLSDLFRVQDDAFSVIDLKARYRGREVFT